MRVGQRAALHKARAAGQDRPPWLISTTSYLGLSLPSPLVLASSSLSNRVENFQLAEQSGAGAVVVRSLFEEQIEAADTALQEAITYGSDITPEATRSFFPHQRIGPAEYLQLINRAKRAVRIPVIGSVNCVAPGSWSEYAKQVAEAGADALEVNLYAVQADPDVSAAEVEARYLEVVSSIVQSIRIPVAVKLSPYFTALSNFVRRLDGTGARGYVLFNRFLQPDISPERLSLHNAMALSEPQEMLLSLRWVALLYGRTPADLGGVHRRARRERRGEADPGRRLGGAAGRRAHQERHPVPPEAARRARRVDGQARLLGSLRLPRDALAARHPRPGCVRARAVRTPHPVAELTAAEHRSGCGGG